jgi:hypothetical protein
MRFNSESFVQIGFVCIHMRAMALCNVEGFCSDALATITYHVH